MTFLLRLPGTRSRCTIITVAVFAAAVIVQRLDLAG
jgi:hypothetical protein